MIPNQTVSSKDVAGAASGKVATMVIKAGAGVLLSLFGYNGGAAQWIHLHDAAAQPANGTVPLHRFAIAAADNFSVIVPRSGINFGVGIVACVSTTADTTTLGAQDAAMLATILA